MGCCDCHSILGVLSIVFFGGGGFWLLGVLGLVYIMSFWVLGVWFLVLGMGLRGFVFCSLGFLWLSF